MPWDPDAPDVMRLRSGRLIRGRGVSRPLPDGPAPDFGIYLLRDEPPAFDWDRAVGERVEVACLGGRGRTGIALAASRYSAACPRGKRSGTSASTARRAGAASCQRRYATRFRAIS